MTQADFQAEKAVVLKAHEAIDGASPEAAADALSEHVIEDYYFRGMYPFYEQTGAAAVADAFWAPLKRAMGPLQRRPQMFFAGRDNIEPSEPVWVVQMGHLMGLWDAPWIDIAPSRKIAFLRYAEFNRVENGKIAETASFVDVLSMIHQAGFQPLPPQTGASILTPGPRTSDGLLYDVHDPAEGRRTMDLIEAMIDDLVGEGVASDFDHMDRFWTKDMCWFGPAGIGASAFREGYRRGHTGPFEDGLEFVSFNGHKCHVAEGNYGGFFGWPNLTMRNTGGYLGLPAQETPADMRIVDLYRREGDLLAENWIFIDMLHFLSMQGLDVIARLKDYPRT